jgi:hypothetical protein
MSAHYRARQEQQTYVDHTTRPLPTTARPSPLFPLLRDDHSATEVHRTAVPGHT